eukprot:sb/3474433/
MSRVTIILLLLPKLREESQERPGATHLFGSIDTVSLCVYVGYEVTPIISLGHSRGGVISLPSVYVAIVPIRPQLTSDPDLPGNPLLFPEHPGKLGPDRAIRSCVVLEMRKLTIWVRCTLSFWEGGRREYLSLAPIPN